MSTLNEEFMVPETEQEPDQAWEVEGLVNQKESPPGCLDLPSSEAELLPTIQPDSVNKWDPRLILDIATGVDDMEEIFVRYGLTELTYLALSKTELFRRELAMAIRDARENGVPFASKARVQAESYLQILDDLVYDKATPASTRLEAIRSIVKWGRLEVEKGSVSDENKTQVNVQINF